MIGETVLVRISILPLHKLFPVLLYSLEGTRVLLTGVLLGGNYVRAAVALKKLTLMD